MDVHTNWYWMLLSGLSAAGFYLDAWKPYRAGLLPGSAVLFVALKEVTLMVFWLAMFSGPTQEDFSSRWVWQRSGGWAAWTGSVGAGFTLGLIYATFGTAVKRLKEHR